MTYKMCEERNFWFDFPYKNFCGEIGQNIFYSTGMVQKNTTPTLRKYFSNKTLYFFFSWWKINVLLTQNTLNPYNEAARKDFLNETQMIDFQTNLKKKSLGKTLQSIFSQGNFCLFGNF